MAHRRTIEINVNRPRRVIMLYTHVLFSGIDIGLLLLRSGFIQVAFDLYTHGT